jgi:hypothetical protein
VLRDFYRASYGLRVLMVQHALVVGSAIVAVEEAESDGADLAELAVNRDEIAKALAAMREGLEDLGPTPDST